MPTLHPGSQALVPLGSSPDPTPNPRHLPKLPSFDEIDDFVNRMQETTDALSRLLLKETRWRSSLSSDQRKSLDICVERFCSLCEQGVDLLQTFFDFSQDFTTLFASILDPDSYPSIEQFASSLWSEVAVISTQIISVEQHYKKFASRFKDLMNMAPRTVPSVPQDLDKILQRLDAFWKVVSTYLASVLQGRAKLPDAHTSREAKNQWAEYKGCLSGAMDALRQSSDALQVASGAQAANLRNRSGLRAMLLGKDEPHYSDPKALESASHHNKHHSSNRLKRRSGPKMRETGADDMKRGFAAFWHRLTQRQATRPALAYNPHSQPQESAHTDRHQGSHCSSSSIDGNFHSTTVTQGSTTEKALPALPDVVRKGGQPELSPPVCTGNHHVERATPESTTASSRRTSATSAQSHSQNAQHTSTTPTMSATLRYAMQTQNPKLPMFPPSPDGQPRNDYKYTINPYLSVQH